MVHSRYRHRNGWVSSGVSIYFMAHNEASAKGDPLHDATCEQQVRPQSILVENGATAPLIVPRGEVTTVFNSDTTDTVTLGDNNAVQPGDPFSIPISPGQTYTFDGSQPFDLFAGISIGATALLIICRGLIAVNMPAQSPATAPPLIAIATASSGATVDIIGGSAGNNPKQYPIQLRTCSISSFLATTAAIPGFNAQDLIQDSAGNQYLANQVGLPAVPGGVPFGYSVPIIQDMQGAIVPAKKRLQINNDPTTPATVLHRCTATVIYYLVN